MCKCIAQMDKHLAPMNTRLALAMTVNVPTESMDTRLMVTTVKIDLKKRGRPKTALASFCPFCGKRAGDTSSTESI